MDHATEAWIISMLRPYSRRILAGVAIATGSGVISTIDPLLMRQLIDHALSRRAVDLVCLDVILIALCFVGRSALMGASGLCGFRVSQNLAQDLRTQLLSHMTALSADWHERTLPGQKVARIEQDVEQVAQYGSDVPSTVFRVLVFFLVNLGIMMTLNWRMTACVLPLLPMFFWLRLRFRRAIQERADCAQAEIGNAAAYLTEHLGAVPQIQLIGAERYRISKTVNVWLDVIAAQWAQRQTEIVFGVTVTSVLAAGILFVLGLGAHEYFIGVLTVGGLVAFYAYVTRIFEPVASAMELYARTERMLASLRRIREVLEIDPSVPNTGNIQSIDKLRTGLSCQHVSFGYVCQKMTIDGICFDVRCGERIAFVGRSGCGKSTLMRLLARLADPSGGHLLLDSQPLREYELRELRRVISYVPQHPVLFSGSIRENLRYANPDATDKELQTALKVVQFAPVLDRLARGLDTELRAEASGISGGEKQRIAIARALLRHPEILILDESTSALDLPTEAKMFQAVARFRPDMAMLLVSHRLRSLTWVDRIIVLDDGRVVASGTHSELYRSRGLYRDLFEQDQSDGDIPGRALCLDRTIADGAGHC